MSNSNVKIERTAKEEQLLKEYYDIKYKDWLCKDFSEISEFQKNAMAKGIRFANFKMQLATNDFKQSLNDLIPSFSEAIKAFKKFTNSVNKKRKERAK